MELEKNVLEPSRVACRIPKNLFKYLEKPPELVIDIGRYGTMIQLDRSILEKLLANPDDFKAVTKEYDIIMSPKQLR
jgi:hypothetical protein